MGEKGDITKFAAVDQQRDPNYFIRFLDTGNAIPDVLRIKATMHERLQLCEGLTLLDVGCGTGDDVRSLAQLLGASGKVVGVDFSGAMTSEAQRRHSEPGLPIEFEQGDVQDLRFPEASFDRCRSERTLMHVDDAGRALNEMVRVLRPGGRMVIFDFDWETIFVDSPYKSTTRSVVRSFSDGIKQGWIGRSLPRMFEEAGLRHVLAEPHPVRFPNLAFAHRLFDAHLAQAVAAGMLPEKELRLWWKDLERAEEQGRLLAGLLGFVVSGTKP
jgi:ubiquinone/menaquinone biosynthesis C-methylase UbiE